MASAAAGRFLSRVSRLSSSSSALSILTSRPIAPLSRLSRTSLLSSTSSFSRHVRFAHDEVPTGPKIQVPVTFIDPDGHRWTVSATVGDTILQTADKYEIPLLGECGGGGWPRENYGEGPMCRSCMVFVDNSHVARVASMEADEQRILYWVDNSTKKSTQPNTYTTAQLTQQLITPPPLTPMSAVHRVCWWAVVLLWVQLAFGV